MSTADRRAAALGALGITPWVRRDATGRDAAVADPAPVDAHPVDDMQPTASRTTDADPASLDWPELEAAVAACTACALHRGRTQTVFGVGDRAADWLIVGEAPGAEEDRRGEPFVGRAGKLLDAMLAAIGLDRGRVFIANVLKCRPPDNRDPRPEEAAACAGYLHRQIALLRPRLILAVGRVAAHHLLDTDEKVGRLRGTVHRHEPSGLPLVVTYHPAYLLRSPAQKRKAWDDLLLACRVAEEARA